MESMFSLSKDIIPMQKEIDETYIILEPVLLEPSPSRQFKLCPHPNHTSCTIQKDKPCLFRNSVHTMSFLAGKMSTVNESNLHFEQLIELCAGGQAQFSSYDNVTSRVDVICRRQVENTIFRLPNDAHNPTVLLPGWGEHWPGMDDESQYWFPLYSTGILVNDTVCFWPHVPNLSETEKDLALWTDETQHSPVYYKKAMISQGFFDNIWHASSILNTWCRMREEVDLHFVVQSLLRKTIPSYLFNFGSLLGISKERIIHQRKQAIVVEETILAASYRDIYVDWSCLHGVLRQSFDPDADRYAMLYVRNESDVDRNIPYDIIRDLEIEIVKRIPDLRVKRFNGREPLEELQRQFANAKIVIGPHGAGLVNIVFCQEETPVVEFFTRDVFRPWQMFGGHSILLPWWPIMVDSFDSRSQILAAVSVVEKALEHLSQVS